MTVRAKFKVNMVTLQMGSTKNEEGKWVPAPIKTVHLSPVYSDDPNSENKKFWQASPSGKIELGCINMAAADQFELDKEYYIDFTKAN
jgi:hypothetical protein